MKFTSKHHQTWQILFSRQVSNINKFANREFLEGFKRLNLPSDKIPDSNFLNSRLKQVSDWRVVQTPIRYLSDEEWAFHMSRKEFPITNFIRARNELNFTPEPDVFHDIFGHLPMLMNPKLVKIIDIFSSAYKCSTKEQRATIAQLWWNTIEFGLISELGETKCFGAGLMSSFGEIAHSVSPQMQTNNFTISRAIKKSRAVSSFHQAFLTIKSIGSLEKELTEFFETRKGKS